MPHAKRRNAISGDADRIVAIIKQRAGGRRYTRPGELRNWIRLEFGIPVKGLLLPIDETAYVTGDRTAIVLNVAHPDWRQIELLLHELSEWILMSEQPALDGLASGRIGYDGAGASGLRHEISTLVAARVMEAWGMKDQASSFSLVDKLCLQMPADREKYSRPRTEVETVSGDNPDGRAIGKMAQ